MLKKAFSLYIALMMLFGCTFALAASEKYQMVEDFQKFDIEVEIPEGALYEQNPKDDWLCLEIWYDDPSKPSFDIHVAFSEETDSKFLKDFTQEETDHLLSMVNEGFSMPSNEFFATPSGNTILFSQETDPEAGSYASMITVYEGFFFSLYCCHKDYSPLTEEDVRLMHQIIEGTWITNTNE